ncbi:MAG: dihydropteroate synthase [Dermatophilaceae bacterium]
MGVVNVTPDSFSDGGAWLEPAAAIAHGRALLRRRGRPAGRRRRVDPARSARVRRP